MTIRWREIVFLYVNLSYRADRRQHIAEQLAKVGITAERFEALRFEDYDGPEEDVRLMMPTRNTIGQWLSMAAVIAKAKPGKVVGLLEDDALLCSDFTDRLQYIEDNFHRSFDVFFLGATFHADEAVWHPELGRDFGLTDIPHIVRVYGAFSNQGMLINGDSAERILSMMREVMPQSRGSDHALIQIQPQLNCYCFVPGMVFQIDGPSDVSGGFTKFSDFYKSLGEYVWADRLEDFDYDQWSKNHQ